MPKLFQKILRENIFADMRDVESLLLPRNIYNRLLNRLEWSRINNLEDFGYLTINKNNCATILDIIIAPDDFKHEGWVDVINVETEWFKKLEVNLKKEHKKIGTTYHTHSANVEYPRILHERFCTEMRGMTDSIAKEYNLSRLGIKPIYLADVILEFVKNEPTIYTFVPLRQPVQDPEHYGSTIGARNVKIKIIE